MKTSDLNIFQRINAVRQSVPYVRKDARVQGYAAVTHDQVTAVLHDALVANGIVILPCVLESDEREKTTKSGTVMLHYLARFEVFFVNVDEPSDRFSVIVDATADDSGDKAPGKALSYAVKSALLKVFTLETGEHDESRVEDDRRAAAPKITSDQAQQIERLLSETHSDKAKFLRFVKANDVKSIAASQFEYVVKMLEKKRQEEKKHAA